MTAAETPARVFGALINRNSRKNRKLRPDDLQALGPNIEMTDEAADVPAALARLAAKGVNVLAVSGGDGAVLTTLSAILLEKAFVEPPIFCVIPSGTTNMTAGDIGFKGGLAAAKALAESGGGRILKRSILQIDNVVDEAGVTGAHAGMFFGAIGICRAIAFCRRHLHSRGLVGAGASWLTLLPLLVRSLTTSKADGVLAPAPATIRVLDHEGNVIETLEGPWSVLMASSLQKLVMGVRPFWGQAGVCVEDVRAEDALFADATFVRAPPPKLGRNIGALLFGKTRRPAEPGYVSRRAAAYEIAYTGQVTLDGELFDVHADRPMRLGIAGEIRFLVP